MARNRSTDSSAEVSGGESFLDIVANIVGILILLVLIVGVRISTVPLSSDDGAASPSEPLLTAAMVNEQADAAQILGRDVAQLASRAGYLQAVAADRDRERNELATYMAAVEEELTNQKSRLSAEDGKRMQVRAELTSVKFELDRLDKRKIGLLTSEVAPVRVVHTPTPIVRKSSKNSMHLRVEGGKVDVVPFEQLIDQVKRNAKDVLRSANAHGGVAAGSNWQLRVFLYGHRRTEDSIGGARLGDASGRGISPYGSAARHGNQSGDSARFAIYGPSAVESANEVGRHVVGV